MLLQQRISLLLVVALVLILDVLVSHQRCLLLLLL